MKNQNLFSEFYYDVLSYIIPGGLLALTFFNYFNLRKAGQNADIKFLELFGPQVFKDYSWFTWIIIGVSSYLLGMLIAGVMFYLMGKFNNLLGYTHVFGELLKNPTPPTHPSLEEKRIEGIRKEVIGEIVLYFNLESDIHDWNDYIDKNDKDIFYLVRNYVLEKSILPNPVSRYYERMALMRNFGFSILFVSLNLLWMLKGETLSFKIPLFSGSIVFLLLSYLYNKLQGRWYVETVLLRFYTIRQIEKSESLRYQENKLLRERLEQVEKEVKKQRSGADVLSQLARQFMKQAPPGDNE